MTLLAAASNGKALWYATRGTGVVALLLLTASVVLGVLGSARWRTNKVPRFVVGTLHRNLSLLAIAFVAAHIVTSVADHFAPIGYKDGVFPFLSPYRPIWLGFGTVAFDLMLALVVTSLLRARLGMRLWRAVHWLAYASWPVALLHSLGAGSDARSGWMLLVGLGSCLAIMLALALRVARSAQPPGRRLVAAGATVAVPLALLVWYQTGPARHGWAARAGTPVSLLRRQASAGGGAIGIARSLPPTSFESRLSGRLDQNGPDSNGLVRVNILADVQGQIGGKLRITLWGEPSQEGGVALTASDVAFGADGTALPYVGRVVALNGNRVDAQLANADGKKVELLVDLQLNRATSAVTGVVRGRAG